MILNWMRLILLSFLGVGGVFVESRSAFSQTSFNSDPCYRREIFESSKGTVCRRILVEVKVDATRSAKDLLDSTTYAAIEAWKIFTPGVGWIVENAFKSEKNKRQLWLTTTILPPPGYRHYVHCVHGWTAVSARGAGEGWVSVRQNAGVHRVWIGATGLFKGRNFAHGTVSWIAVHPEALNAAVAAKECAPAPA